VMIKPLETKNIESLSADTKIIRGKPEVSIVAARQVKKNYRQGWNEAKYLKSGRLLSSFGRRIALRVSKSGCKSGICIITRTGERRHIIFSP